jgi:hypothetical protein
MTAAWMGSDWGVWGAFHTLQKKVQKKIKFDFSTFFKKFQQKMIKGNANGMRCSQAVTHLSTIRTQRRLTSVSGRELVYPTWYGRWRKTESTGSLLVRPCRRGRRLRAVTAVPAAMLAAMGGRAAGRGGGQRAAAGQVKTQVIRHSK